MNHLGLLYFEKQERINNTFSKNERIILYVLLIPKNMNHQKEEFESKNLDHLGIIAGMIDDIGIVEKINEIFIIDSREKVNTGEVVKAIILNGLGFVSRPLYLFPEFFRDKAVENLIGTGIKADNLNDDKNC